MERQHHLPQRRLHLGWSQSVTAREAGLKDPSYVSLAERGKGTAAWRYSVRRAIVRAERLRPVGSRWKPSPPPPPEPSPIEATRALAAKVPDSPEWQALLAAMKERIFDLYDELKLEEGDHILEFVPEPLASAWLEEYFWPPD